MLPTGDPTRIDLQTGPLPPATPAARRAEQKPTRIAAETPCSDSALSLNGPARTPTLNAFDPHLPDDHRLAGAVVRVARHFGDFYGDLLAFDHFAENGVADVLPPRGGPRVGKSWCRCGRPGICPGEAYHAGWAPRIGGFLR